MTPRKPAQLLICLLAAFALLAGACGGGDTAATDGTIAPTSDDGVFRIAMVAPSASNDVAFSQSMFDAIWLTGENREIEFKFTDSTFIVDEAGAALRGYAEAGFDLIIAHGSQYGEPLQAIAPEFPNTAFAWGTSSDTFGIPNVSAYTVSADEGGYVMGTIAAQLTETKIIGVVGPLEVGDAALYINGFTAGAIAQDPEVTVNTEYIGSFSDVELAATTATTHLENGADILTGSSQMAVGATGIASAANVPWFGTQANQTTLSPDIVVASQVYHWEVALEQMIADIEAGSLGGETYLLTLGNGGLEIEFNNDFVIDREIRTQAEATAAGLTDGSLSTGL